MAEGCSNVITSMGTFAIYINGQPVPMNGSVTSWKSQLFFIHSLVCILFFSKLAQIPQRPGAVWLCRGLCSEGKAGILRVSCGDNVGVCHVQYVTPLKQFGVAT